jgi:branched-chain amino acid transport system substrate-binding protein
MNRKLLCILLVVALGLLTFAQCLAAPAAKGDIIVGLIQDLSGPGSVFGNSCKKGSELAIAKINAAGGLNGRKIKLISYDIKGDIQESINAFTRLADVDKAVAVVGPPLSNVGLATISITNEKKVSFLGAFGDPACMINKDGSLNKYMFLAQPSAPYLGELAADYALKKLGYKNFAFFTRQDHSYNMAAYKAFVDYVKAKGGKVLTSQFCNANDTDFKTQLTKINESKPDVLVSIVTTREDVIMVQQANQLGIKLPIIGNSDFSLPFASLLNDRKIANQIYFPNNLDYEQESIQAVRKEYKAMFNTEPDIKSYIGYDEITILAEAIKQAGYRTTRAAIRDSLENKIKNLPVTQGMFTMDPKTHMPLGLTMVIYKIEDGQYKFVEPYVPGQK